MGWQNNAARITILHKIIKVGKAHQRRNYWVIKEKEIVYFCEQNDKSVKNVLVKFFSIESGFRNSGLTIGKAGKLVLAIRSSHGLEVPLSDPVSGQLLVDKNYLTFLTNIANEKLAENLRRIQFFEQRCDKYVWKD